MKAVNAKEGCSSVGAESLAIAMGLTSRPDNKPVATSQADHWARRWLKPFTADDVDIDLGTEHHVTEYRIGPSLQRLAAATNLSRATRCYAAHHTTCECLRKQHKRPGEQHERPGEQHRGRDEQHSRQARMRTIGQGVLANDRATSSREINFFKAITKFFLSFINISRLRDLSSPEQTGSGIRDVRQRGY